MSTTALLCLSVTLLLAVQAAVGKEVCCGDLGCFNTLGEFFDKDNRPFETPPDCSVRKGIIFRLKTRAFPLEPYTLNIDDLSTIRQSRFDPAKETKLLIHGWLDKYSRPVWRDIASTLLEQGGDYNVIHVDWSSAAWFTYLTAIGNLRLVGAYTAKLVSILVNEFGVDPAKVHIIGHSLGTHGAGYTGYYLQKDYNIKIARITGLDPAGLAFTGMPPIVTLDPTDAEIVDTMVTNSPPPSAPGVGMGSTNIFGLLNFFPNGGILQPGCRFENLVRMVDINGSIARTTNNPEKYDDSPFDMAKIINNLEDVSLLESEPNRNKVLDYIDVAGCSHTRALTLFRDSIAASACISPAQECDSFEQFQAGSGCSGVKSPIGLRADLSLADKDKVKKFYTVTSAIAPFCSTVA